MCAGARQQRRQQSQAGRIRPLHVVEEYDQRAVLAAEDLQEVLENMVEAILRFSGFERGKRRLRSDDAFQRRNDFGDDAAVAPDGTDDGVAPCARLALAFGEELANQVLQRTDDGAERHVALQLIEFAGDEIAMLLAERHAQLLHQRGLADAGGPGQHDEFGIARGGAAQRHRQRVNLAAASVEL